jgi:cytochrome c biogenesis protein CcmG/thiol:disulfide interchange protein DsbE
MIQRTVAIFFIATACYFSLPGGLPASITAAETRKAAPDFDLKDAKGVPVKLSSHKGKVVLLDFWATWCHGCKTEIPWYMEFQRKYEKQGLVAIGVSMDKEGWDVVKPYLKEHPINYAIVVGNEELSKQYGVAELPVTLLIDRDGKIADAHTGMVERDVFDKEIQALLKEGLAK